jgi:tetratricopeptide (TPR) repeat protein
MYLNEFQQASEILLQLQKFCLDACNSALIYQAYFFDGLSEAVAVQKKNSGESKQLAGKRGLNQLGRYFQHSPKNVFNKILLSEAECCVLKGQYEKAMSKFDALSEYAREQNNLPEQALASERAAIGVMEWGREEQALIYFERAHSWYASWGAPVKLGQLSSYVLNESLDKSIQP